MKALQGALAKHRALGFPTDMVRFCRMHSVVEAYEGSIMPLCLVAAFFEVLLPPP